MVMKDQPPTEPQPLAVQELTAWRNGAFYFMSAPLADVFVEIERQFKIQIHIGKNLAGLTFTGKFDRTDGHSALEIVCLSSGLTYQRLGQNVFEVR